MKLKNKPTYNEEELFTVDIEVEDTHSYQLENGAVVHNTTSKLFGLTEGWHLPAHGWYLRWVQFRSDDPLVDQYKNAGYPYRDLVQYSGTTIIGFPTEPVTGALGLDDKLVTAGEATPEEQYKWLMLGEKYWINGTDEEGNPLTEAYGNQISYTLKYKPDLVDYKHFKAMMAKYQSQIRACSVMPQVNMAAFEYVPEEAVSKAQYEAIAHEIEKVMKEDIGKEHVSCDIAGGCPIDFDEDMEKEAASQ
jgi:hypothetical protein